MASERITDIDRHIGAKIRARRRQRDVSLESMAQVGVTWQQLWKYERGDNRVAASRLAQIATFLDTPVIWFFPPEFGGAEMPPDPKEVREREEYERLRAKFEPAGVAG